MLKGHWLLLIAAMATALRFVPAFPHFYPSDPNRWAVVGALVVVGAMLARGWRRTGIEPHRSLLMAFLVALPVVYLADWVRFGGSTLWLAVELGGGLLFWTIAMAAVRKGPHFLAVGIGGHAFWDLMHFGTSNYVPDWYVIACLIVDLALSVVVVRLIRESRGGDGASIPEGLTRGVADAG